MTLVKRGKDFGRRSAKKIRLRRRKRKITNDSARTNDRKVAFFFLLMPPYIAKDGRHKRTSHPSWQSRSRHFADASFATT